MNSANDISAATDRAREALCHKLAGMINSGAFTVRTRVIHSADVPVEAWFYAHRDNGWQKEPGGVTDRELVRGLHETLAMLASKGHADEWSVKQHSTADGHDTDIQFHKEKLKDRLGEKLESALAGLLFRDGHDSKQDVRRSIRVRR